MPATTAHMTGGERALPRRARAVDEFMPAGMLYGSNGHPIMLKRTTKSINHADTRITDAQTTA